MDVSKNKITSASQLRATLLFSIEAIIDGRMTISQANGIVGLSAEIHKSIRQEWDMKCYAAQNLALSEDRVIDMLEMK